MQKRFDPPSSLAIWTARAVALLPFWAASTAQAQIVPSTGAVGTTVTQNGDAFDIEGGTQTGENLFHQFDAFSVGAGETANFTSDSSVSNIVGQVSGNSPSYLSGQLQVSGSDADLYLLNPAGVLFGPDARLSLSGSFTATTADQLEFGGAWLDVMNPRADYSQLSGEPSAFRFAGAAAGAVVNQANLSVSNSESIHLVGGSVVSEGRLDAPGGEVGLVAVSGNRTIRLSAPDSLLNIEVAETAADSAIQPLDLPVLLTGKAGAGTVNTATGLTVDANGEVRLEGQIVGAETVATAGDILVRSPNGSGGAVMAAGEAISLVNGSIDASGRYGGAVITNASQLYLGAVEVNAGGELSTGQWLIGADSADIVSGASGTNEIDPVLIEAALDSGTNVSIAANGERGDISLLSDINQTGASSAGLLFAGRRYSTNGAEINLASTGQLTFDINQIAPEAAPLAASIPATSIEDAIASIGNVTGDRLLRLGTGEYTFSKTTTIDTDVAIAGAPDRGTTLSASGSARIFDIAPAATVNLSNLIFTATDLPTGKTSAVSGGLVNAGNLSIDNSLFENNSGVFGGAIESLSNSTLSISNSDFINNSATNLGGAINASGSAVSLLNTAFHENSAQTGGALRVSEGSDLFISGGIVQGNRASQDGGGIAIDRGSRAEIVDTWIAGNSADRYGGGLVEESDRTIEITESLFEGNSAGVDGGGLSMRGSSAISISNSAIRDNRAGDDGGGLHLVKNSRAVLSNMTVSGNSANDLGGGLYQFNSADLSIFDSAIQGNTAGNEGGGLSNNATSGNTVVVSSAFENNTATNLGGGIASRTNAAVEITAATFTANSAQQGGGLFQASGRLSATDTAFVANTAGDDGGGVRLSDGAIATFELTQFLNNVAQFGGGLELSQGSTANVADSTFSSNEAISFGGAAMVDTNSELNLSNTTLSSNQALSGGGLFVIGTSRLVNATLSGNSATQNGGGVMLYGSDAALFAQNSTLTNNSADLLGGGLSVREALATVELLNTIVAANTAGELVTADIEGPVIDAGNNLVGIAATSVGLNNSSLSGTLASPLDPGLEALADNGGRTETHGLRADSVAIDAGASVQLPASDQRGHVRILGAAVDIGAVEADSVDPPPDPPSPAPGPAIDPSSPAIDPPEPVLPPAPPPTPEPSIPTLPAPEPPSSELLSSELLSSESPASEVSSTISGSKLSDLRLETLSTEIDEAAVVLPAAQQKEQDFDSQFVQRLEKTFGQSFNEYWDLSLGPELTFPEVQAILQQAKEEYAINSAVIYAAFSPERESDSDSESDAHAGHLLEVALEPADDDRLNLSLVMPEGELVNYQLPFTRKQVTRQVMMFRSMVSDPGDDVGYRPLAYQVYQWLLAPLETELAEQGIQNLMYALDTGLRTVPIAAMRDDSGFALERFGMSVVPNVGLMQTDFGASVGRSTVAMGVTEFETQAPLPAVPVELDTINAFIPAAQTILNEGTTFEAIASVQALARPGVLHLATHANFDAHSPDSSYIQLWNDPLSMSEFRQLDWQGSDLDLLVLSACLTAMSSPQAELGFAGLAAASGVDATVGSLWQVSDVGTLALMSEFYAQLNSSGLRFEALRRAQLALMRGDTRLENGNLLTSRGEIDLPDEWDIPADATLAHPFFWSAFTMVGNPW